MVATIGEAAWSPPPRRRSGVSVRRDHGQRGPAPAGPLRPRVVTRRWCRYGAVDELLVAGRLEGGQVAVVVSLGHLERRLRGLPPSRRRPPAAFLLAGLRVDEQEVGAGRLRDDADGIPLVGGPAAEVENDPRTTHENLVRHPDHPALEDVTATIGVTS